MSTTIGDSLPLGSLSVNPSCQDVPPEAKLAPWQQVFLDLLDELGVLALDEESAEPLSTRQITATCPLCDSPDAFRVHFPAFRWQCTRGCGWGGLRALVRFRDRVVHAKKARELEMQPNVNSQALEVSEPMSDMSHKGRTQICVNSDTPNFRETWETVPAYVCGRAKKLFKHPERSEYRLPSLYCGRWTCPVCRKKLVRKWSEHLEAKIREAAASGKHLCVVVADEHSWGALHRGLCRRKAQYVRFSTAPLKLIVATEDGELVTTAGAVSTPITPDQAVQLARTLCQIVAKTGKGTKRITTCRKWKLPPKPRSAVKWVEVGIGF
ncbi:MAG: hypothetical protein H5T99_00370 [Moorella sp. (in: Bacteria)]|nr:hypothetical protein [Moorella sp. (in: firmicutes)]